MVRALYNDGIAGTWTEKVYFEIPGMDTEEVSIPLSINNVDYYSIYTSTSYLRIMGGYYAIEAEEYRNSLVTPKFSDDLEGALFTLECNLEVSNDDEGYYLFVGTVSEPRDMDSFEGQLRINSLGIRKSTYQVILKDVPEDHKYVAIMLYKEFGFGSGYLHVFDLRVEEAVSGCIPPSGFQINAGSNFLSLFWGDAYKHDGWQVKYGRTGFDVDTEGELVTTEDVVIDIEDLEPNTSYDLYLRTICEVGRESEWSDPITIKTHILGDYCNDAVDISTLTSPVIESTANAFANGYYKDLYGYIYLNPGGSIEMQIVQADSSSAFCDVYAGEDCDGQMFSCGNNPESSPVAWYNNSDEPQVVSYVLGDIGGEGDDFTLNWEYGTEPICVFNLEFEQFSTDGQDFIRIKWGFTGNVHPDKVVYGPAEFDPATGGTVMQLNQSLNSCSIYDLVKGQLYDIYIFSPCVDAKPVKRSVMLPCEPQVSILNVQPYDIIDLSDGGGNVEIAYNDNCNNLLYLIFMDENSSGYYLSNSYQLEGVEGIQTLKIDPSLPSGRYNMALAVAGLSYNGYPDMKYLYSQIVYVVNNTKSIKFSYPSFDEVYQYQEGINNYVDFSWLTSNVGFVNVEYSINGGLTWESVSYKQSTGRGVPTEDYIEARLKVPESWVGKELMLRVSSTFDSTVFAVSPTVTILPEQSPFTLISPTEEHPAIIADVRIWPVPAKDVLYVRSSVANDIRIAELYDLTGRKLDQTIVNGQAFTISKLASGVYVVVVEGKSYKVVKK